MSASSAPSWPNGCSRPSIAWGGSAIMANVLLGVTGSVAAIKTIELYTDLKNKGNAVKVVPTPAALYFFDPLALDALRSDNGLRRNPDVVVLDEDEWPGL